MAGDNGDDFDPGVSFDAFSAALDTGLGAGDEGQGAAPDTAHATTAASQQGTSSTNTPRATERSVQFEDLQVDENGNVVTAGEELDGDEDGEGEEAAGEPGAKDANQRIANLRREMERKLTRTNQLWENRLQDTQAKLNQAVGFLQAMAAKHGLQQPTKEPEKDPFEGLDPNDPYDRAVIAQRKAEMAVARVEKLEQARQQQEQDRQASAQGAATVQWANTTNTNLVEHWAKQMGIADDTAKYHAWNAGMLALQQRGLRPESVQDVSRAVYDSLKTFRPRAVAKAPVPTAAANQPTARSTFSPSGRTTAGAKKPVSDMSRTEFDAHVLDYLDQLG